MNEGLKQIIERYRDKADLSGIYRIDNLAANRDVLFERLRAYEGLARDLRLYLEVHPEISGEKVEEALTGRSVLIRKDDTPKYPQNAVDPHAPWTFKGR